MNQAHLTPADPLLTAYALGELDVAETAAVAAALTANPALQAEVEEIRACAATLVTALAAEETAERWAAPLTGSDSRTLTISATAHPVPQRPAPSRRRWLVFPQFYFVAGGLAAAGLAVFVAVNRDEILERERTRAALRQAAQERAEPVSMIFSLPLARESTGPVPPAAAATKTSGTLALTPDYGRASLDAVQRSLNTRRLPPAATVQPAELVNAFPYRRPAPPLAEAAPLAAALEVGDVPWAPHRRLVRIGFRGREVDLAETRRAILDGLAQTKATIALDVRILVEFNPARVAGYRLLGRTGATAARVRPVDQLATAEAMVSGQAFTALYEITPAARVPRPAPPAATESRPAELLAVRLHYTEPAGGPAKTMEFSLDDPDEFSAPASADLQLAAAVADFATVLHTAPENGAVMLQDVLAWAATANPADDLDGRRADFVELVRRAQLLME